MSTQIKRSQVAAPTLKAYAAILSLALLTACNPAPERPDGSSRLATPIAVLKDGVSVGAIDEAWLAAHPSSVEWGEGSARSLAPLFGQAWLKASSELHVTGAAGATAVFKQPGSRPDSAEPVLVVNRKGESLVTLRPLSDSNSFHGRGGARSRGRPSGLRIASVETLELKTGASSESALPGATTPLRIRMGTSIEAMDLELLRSVPTSPLSDESGTPRGVDYWDLRVVSKAILSGASIEGFTYGAGETLAVSLEDWTDPEKTPTLRRNRRGQWKFQWVSPTRTPLFDERSADDLTELILRAP